MISASESMFLDFDGWLKQQPGDVQDDHAVHFKSFVDPARLAAEKDRLASIEFVHEQTRRPRTEIADNWHLYRGGVAERLAEMPSGATDYKWEAVKDDDAGFAGVAREAATFQRDRRNLISNVHRQAFEAAMSIDPELPAKRKAEVFAGLNADGVPGMNADDLPALYRIYNDAVEQAKFNTQGERSAAREAAALVRKGEEAENFALDYLTPAVERLMKLPKDRRDLAIEFLRQDFSKGGKSDGEQVGLRMRGKRPMGVDSTIEGAALSLGRGAADVTNKLVAYGERMVEALGARDDSEFRAVESRLRELVNGTLAPLNADGMIQQGFMSAAQSLPAMAMIAAGPVGTALSVSYYQQGSYEKFKADPRLAGASDAKISAMSLASGVAQMALDKVELGILSKLPGAATILGNLRGVANPLGYVGKEAGKAVLGIAAETAVEAVQDNYTDAIAQQVGAWLSSSVASPEWAAVNAEALRSLPELAMTMIPLVTIAHGVGGVRDIHAARALASTPELLRIAGFSESQARAIATAENPVGKLRGMWNERDPMQGAPKGSTPSQVAAQAVEDYKAARDVAVSAADDARATPGVAYVQRTNAGWQVIDTDGQAHTVKSEAAVPGLLVEIGKATTIREAEAMQQIADSIGAKEPAAKQVLTGDKVTVQRDGGNVQVDSALKLIPFTPATLANFNAQLSLLGADSAIVNGANWIAEDGPNLLANKSGEGILTQVHEFAESRFRSLIDNDVYFGNHAISAARVVAPLFDVTRGTAEDKAFAERVQRVASGKTNETEARETLVELVVADVLGRRKDGGSFTPGAITAGVSELINSSANPAERASLGKFRAFLRAVRAYLHGIFSTAARLSKGRRDGTIKPGDDFTTFAEKLLGVDAAKEHTKAVIAEATGSLSPDTAGGMTEADIQSALDERAPILVESHMRSIEDSISVDEDGGESENFEVRWDGSEFMGKAKKSKREESAGDDVTEAEEWLRESERQWAEENLTAEIDADFLDSLRGKMTMPNGFSLGRFEKALTGSVYVKYYRPDGEHKISIRDHDFSAARVAEFGPSLLTYEVEDTAEMTAADASRIFSDIESRAWELFNKSAAESGASSTTEAGGASRMVSGETMESQPALVVNDNSASASLGSVNTLEALAVQLENRIAAGGATVKLEAYADTARTLEGMARAARSNESVEHVLAVGEIEKQRAAMQKRMEAQAREQIERDNSSLLEQPELADAFANEFFDYLFRKKEAGKPFRRSRILSKAAAIKQGIEIGNQYDGIDGLPKWLFSADGIVPDKITKELAETKEFGLPEEDATADADLWPRIRQILDSSEKYRKALRKIEGEMIEARAKARTESRTWAAAQRAKLAASDARDEKRSLVTLDALLANVPAEVRGRVGGFTKIAELTTNDARRKHLMAIVEKLDSEMERYLRRELVNEITATLQKGRARKVAGQKDKGPLGVNGHTWLETAERYMVMGEADLEARELYIDAILGGAEMSDAVIKDLNRQWNFGTGEDAARMALEVEKGIADLFGGATHRDPKTREYTRGSGELEAAWKAAKERADLGRMEWERELEIRRTRREGRRAGLSIESGNHGRPSDIAAREKALQGFGGAAVKYFRKGFTFSEFVGDGFGREGDTHRFAEDTAMEATLTESALWQASQNGLADFLRSLWPRSGKAARLRQLEALATPKKVDGAPVWIPELSEMQAVHLTMLWQDVDSRPWLRKWQYGDGAPEDPRDPAGPDVQAVLEAHLSPQAKLIRDWLQIRYDDQYDSLNDVFRRLHGVNMPRVKNYTPRMVEHGKDAAVIDPLGAGGLSARGVFSGFTKRRRINIAAAPVLADALRAYTQNQRVVTHFVAWAEASNELRAVFSTSASAPFIKGAMGNQGAADLNQWLSDLEVGGVREAQASEIWNRWLRANTASALFGKLGVLAKQIPAAYGAAVEIGWSDYLRSLRRVVTGKAARPVSGAVASRIMQARAFERPAEVGQASSGTGVSPWDARLRRIGIPTTGIDLAMDWLGGRIGATDAFFTARGAAIAYDAHYLDGKAQKMSDAAAHAYAERETERTISRTAQPDSVANKSLAENHAGTWGRIFNQFQSANRQALFMTLAAFRDGGMKSGDAWRKAVTHWIVTGIVTQTIGNLIRDALSDDNDDELWNLGDYGRAMMFGPTAGAVLGVGIFADVLASFMGGFERRFAPSPAAAFVDFGKEITELLKEDDAFELKDGEKIGKALGSFLGGRWAALNVAANLGKQAVGFVDNLATTKTEAMEADAKKQREAEKSAREARESRLSPEQRAALKEARKHGREQRKELDAARWRAAHPD